MHDKHHSLIGIHPRTQDGLTVRKIKGMHPGHTRLQKQGIGLHQHKKKNAQHRQDHPDAASSDHPPSSAIHQARAWCNTG